MRLCCVCCLQLFAKLQATKQEIIDLQESNSRERQELEQTQNELTREIKLKSAFALLLLLLGRITAQARCGLLLQME